MGTSELAKDSAATGALGWAERGLLPDSLVRFGIRRLCAQRLREGRAGGPLAQQRRFEQTLAMLRASNVAILADAANEQHYELPAEFFQLCLGPRLKYSCAYYPTGMETLADAEDAMLELYGERAQLADGQDVLELGCGWGSLTLWMAQRFPASRIVAISNSHSQRQHIEQQAQKRGLTNIRIITVDVNHLELATAAFDRCVSIEMFEHMRNYQTLLARISRWLRPQGKLFVHIFAHRTLLYPFETTGSDNWMGRHFFTGGLMPSVNTLPRFNDHLVPEDSWVVNGSHYQRTANHWLANQDRHSTQVLQVLKRAYGPQAASIWAERWRLFWMACAETFGYADGEEWVVAHYRFVQAGKAPG